MTTAAKDAPEQLKTQSDFVREAAEQVADPKKVIEAALTKLVTDPGALLEEPVLEALRAIRAEDPAAYTRYRARAKSIHKDFRVTDLDRLLGQDKTGDENIANKLVALAR